MGHCLTIDDIIFMQIDFKYADLLNDEVFKLVFGQESSKDVMIEFLNRVIPERTIVDVFYKDKEMHSDYVGKKGAVYDLLCMTDDGSRIIVELQKRKQDWYAERTLYYSMYQILKQVNAGGKSYDLYPVYVISILDFTMEQNDGISDVKTVYRLLEECHHTVLTDRVTYIFIELPKFRKSEEELDGDILEGIYFCLKNMRTLHQKPKVLTHGVFDKIFWTTEFLKMDEETRTKIMESMTTERDLENQFEYVRKAGFAIGHKEGCAAGRVEGHAVGRKEGREEGRKEGREEGLKEGLKEGRKAERIDVARRMLAAGLSVEQIAELTQLSIEQIKEIQ